MRWWRHLLDFGRARRAFPPWTMDAIQQAIAASEARHGAQIMFAVEAVLPLRELLAGCDVRRRAEMQFARLGAWDTERNLGVLIYVLLAERAIEIVADRGVVALIGRADWEPAIERMRGHLVRGDWEGGALAGIGAAGALLERHFPRGDGIGVDELSNRPVLL